METKTAYLTRRARQERASAIEATSAGARAAHLELAVRLVRAATEPALWRAWSPATQLTAIARDGDANCERVDRALALAFPLHSSGEFEQLLGQLG